MFKILNLISSQKVINHFTYLLVFLLPLQTRWIIQAGSFNGGYFEYGTISLYLVDIIILFVLLLILISRSNNKIPPLRRGRSEAEGDLSVQSKLWLIIGSLELIIFVSCFFAPDKLIAFYTYGRFLLGIGLFYVLIQNPSPCQGLPLKKGESKTRSEASKIPPLRRGCRASGGGFKRQIIAHNSTLIYIFLASAFFQSVLAIYQSITQSVFANKWLGMAEHLSITLGTSVVELTNGTRWLRAYGSLDHPNMLGGLMVFAILFAVLELLNSPLERDAPIGVGCVTPNHRIKTILLLLSLSISTITLFLTFSRAAWLATVVGICAILTISIIKKSLLAQKRILQSILITSSIFFMLFVGFNDLVTTRLSNNTRLEQKSNTERIDSNREAIAIIKENWIFGVGIGNYTQYLQEKTGDKPAYYYQPVHNVFLLIAAEIGIFGLIIFLALILHSHVLSLISNLSSFSRRAFSPLLSSSGEAKRRPGDPESSSTNKQLISYNISLILALISLFLFDHWLWSLHFGVILFWFMVSRITRY
jgi:hypothetical protein